MISSLPDAGTEGSLFQSGNGVTASTAISAVGTRITHSTGAFVFVRQASLLDDPVEIAVSVFSDENATQLLSADTVRVLVQTACPAVPELEAPSWGINEFQPPTPSDVELTFDNDLRVFTLRATLPYLRDASTYVVDLADFDQDSDDLRASTNCGARAPLPTLAPYNTLWEAAPHSQYPSALGSVDYLAYPPVQSEWTVAAGSSCGNWTLQRSWTFAELVDCQQRDGVTPSVAVLTDAELGQVSYAGAVYINVVRPLDAQDESAGMQRAQFVYPFTLRFQSFLEATATAQSSNDFQMSTREVTLQNGTGCLQMVVQTVYIPGAIGGLINPSVDLPTDGNGVALAVTAASAGCDAQSTTPCVQQWLVESCPVAWADEYNGEYTLRWEVPGAAPDVFGIISIVQQAAPEGVEQQINFQNGIRFFRAEADWLQGENEVVTGVSPGFSTGEIVYVRDDVSVAAGDENNFGLAITNAWICYSENDVYVIEVADGKQGCVDPFILEAERAQLVADGAAVSTGAAALFNVQLDDGSAAFVLDSVVSTGLFFNAQPIAAAGTRNYTVHLQLELTQLPAGGANKRSLSDSRTQQRPTMIDAVYSMRDGSLRHRKRQAATTAVRNNAEAFSLAAVQDGDAQQGGGDLGGNSGSAAGGSDTDATGDNQGSGAAAMTLSMALVAALCAASLLFA